MNERPLSERPAARPSKPKTEPVIETASTTPPVQSSFWDNIGCFGWAAIIIFGILLISTIGGSITYWIQNSQASSGSETYEVSPDAIDPRSTFKISAACDAGMAASAADPSENGERLLKETGNLCSSKEEWEAALYRYPRAIGITEAKFLDGSEFGLLCGSYPEVTICRNKD
jgi:hypothetical protein